MRIIQINCHPGIWGGRVLFTGQGYLAGSNPKGIEARAFLLESIDPHRAAELLRGARCRGTVRVCGSRAAWPGPRTDVYADMEPALAPRAVRPEHLGPDERGPPRRRSSDIPATSSTATDSSSEM